MEWSQGDGPWDEGDDDVYPPAPLPAHERTWRHPSEMGQASWTLSEPPLVLGRGLMFTTGAIGCALGLAILWLMVPSRGGMAPSASASSIGLRTASTLAAVVPATTVAAVTSSVEVIETTQPFAALFGEATLPAEDVPANTMHLDPSAGTDAAIAVVIGDSPYLVTTAHAVGGRAEVSMRLDSGESQMAPVVSVDAAFAYIRPGEGIETIGFPRSGAASPGDVVTVLSAAPATVSYGDTAALAGLAEVAEGTPVVDEDGAIVALCSRASGSLQMVPIGADPDHPVASTSVPTTDGVTGSGAVATDQSPPAWVGIRLGGVKGASDLSVTAVASDSPAEASGLRVGDEIISIDGVAMANAADVVAAVGDRPVGTTITLVVRTSPATGAVAEREVSLVLGERAPTVDL